MTIKVKRSIALALVVVMLAAVGGILAACGDQQEEPQQNEGTEMKVQKDLKFGFVEWPGVTQKTYILKEILDNLGYNVEATTFTVPILIQGLSTGDVDVFAGGWMVTMAPMLDKHLESGAIEDLGTNIAEVDYGPAVPSYVWEAGVHSIGDLDKFADKFDREYYGIEPGNDGNEVMMRAVENDTYGLGDWTVLESSTSAMLAEVKKAQEAGDWIVHSAWAPHWMNVELDMKYLEDPEKIWGENERVDTLARKGLSEDDPNVTKFLSQFKVESDTQSAWIMEYDKEGRDPQAVAEEWVANNLDTVNPWLEGVKTVDGENAQQVLKEAYSG
ncbi:MAG: ABC transporter substrate-binding protein [Firmicutes bacterium]|nr:ABC transporter substrate-binding protein [Bacillota bacterium]